MSEVGIDPAVFKLGGSTLIDRLGGVLHSSEPGLYRNTIRGKSGISLKSTDRRQVIRILFTSV